MSSIQQKQAYIGRPYTVVHGKEGKIVKFTLDKFNPVFIDFSSKKHTLIVSKSGGGKSYLAGVVAEELVRVMDNYCTVLVDPMGIFNTLGVANNNMAELDKWNEQIPDDVIPGAIKCTVYVPAGDATNFLPGTYDKIFALRAPEFSYSTFCYAFDLDALEPQVNLYRKAQALLLRERGTYTLDELVAFVREHGSEMKFQAQTVEALVTKLEALAGLGIIAKSAPEISEIIRDREVVVFDLSLSSNYVAKILVSFLAEKIFMLRRQITRMITKAKSGHVGAKLQRPWWYIPPVQLVIDEAHEYLPNNQSLRNVIKKGRNCGMMITAISQSPDLTKDLYANISHVFVGPLIYDSDIAAMRAMLPIEQGLKEFRAEMRSLVPGTFFYCNVDSKTFVKLKVRPRRTMHPATTELDDERKFFETPRPIVLDAGFPLVGVPDAQSYVAILRHDGELCRDQVCLVIYKHTQIGVARVTWVQRRPLDQIQPGMLVNRTGASDLDGAIKMIHAAEPVKEGELFSIVMLRWIERVTKGV
ncbi:MAG: ATP-binding protein [Candidatus Sigynarchaeota archaeon]